MANAAMGPAQRATQLIAMEKSRQWNVASGPTSRLRSRRGPGRTDIDPASLLAAANGEAAS
jgi:hypothetical protein